MREGTWKGQTFPIRKTPLMAAPRKALVTEHTLAGCKYVRLLGPLCALLRAAARRGITPATGS